MASAVALFELLEDAQSARHTVRVRGVFDVLDARKSRKSRQAKTI